MPSGGLDLFYHYPHVSFSAPISHCLRCGKPGGGALRVRFNEVDCPQTPTRKLEFFAPLCVEHLRSARKVRSAARIVWSLVFSAVIAAALLPAARLILAAAIVPAALAGHGLRRRGLRGGIPGVARLEGGVRLHLSGAAPAPPAAEGAARPADRAFPPAVPYAYSIGAPYSIPEAIAAAKIVDRCNGRFAILDDGILAFLNLSEVRFETPESMRWLPPEAFAASAERPTWLPGELRDGSGRARRGVALFLRRDAGAFVYAGRAELTNWPLGADEARWAVFALDVPLEAPLDRWVAELPAALEDELTQVRARLGRSSRLPALLRRAAKGDLEAWNEAFDDLCHQGTILPEFAATTPFLLRLLDQSEAPLVEEILWLLAAAGGAPEGTDVLLRYLAHGNPELRRPAAFALRAARPDRVLELLKERWKAESEDPVRAAILLTISALGGSAELSFLLQVLRSGASTPLKAVAAVAAVEMQSGAVPAEARHLLLEELPRWGSLDDWWPSVDPTGTVPFDYESAIDRLKAP